MYLGRIVEIGATKAIFEAPQHPYTQSLLKAVPRLVPERRHRAAVLKGDIPSPPQDSHRLPFPSALPEGAGHLPPPRSAGDRHVRRSSFRPATFRDE